MHCVQTAMVVAPNAVEYVPLPQVLLQADDIPTPDEYEPAIHCVQTAMVVAPNAVEYVPAIHLLPHDALLPMPEPDE